MLEKTMKKRIKKDDFTAKKGFFIIVRTKAFIWTAKVSIILSEKNDLREFWRPCSNFTYLTSQAKRTPPKR
jgi:hypothetical protein